MEFLERFLGMHRRGVLTADEAFQAGELLPENRSAFEVGLIYVGHLPSIDVPRSTYNEMISSGALARMESLEIKQALQRFYSFQQFVEGNFPWWREGPLRTHEKLYSYVEFSTAEDPLDEEAGFDTKRRVRYDFEELLQDKELRAGYFWAADTHRDWKGCRDRLAEHGAEILQLVRAELASRN